MAKTSKSKGKNKKSNNDSKKKVDEPISSKNLDKAVQKVINKNAEDKISTAKYPLTQYNSGINATGDIVGIMPIVYSGTGSSGRIGNKIMAKKLILKANIMMNQYATLGSVGSFVPNSRLGVRIMVVLPKTVRGRTDVNNNQGAWLSRLLRDGGSSVSFDGTLDNFFLPINTEVVTKYYDKIIYLTTDSVFLPATNNDGSTINTANTIRRLTIPIIKKSKEIVYDQSYDIAYPASYNPVILLGYCHLDGSTPDTLTTVVSMNFTSFLYYQDV